MEIIDLYKKRVMGVIKAIGDREIVDKIADPLNYDFCFVTKEQRGGGEIKVYQVSAEVYYDLLFIV